MIRVLLVNEFELMGNIITEVLEDEPDIEVIGCVTTPQDELLKISNENVDMVLVSTHLPNDGALREFYSLSRQVLRATSGKMTPSTT